MPVHVVKPGDTLLRIAHKFKLGSWKALFEHPDNATLRERRPDPSQLVPGDVVVIPDDAPKEVTVPSGRTQRFTVKRLKAVFRIVVEDESGRPVASKKFTLQIDDKKIEGVTGPDGLVKLDIAPDPQVGRLTVWPEEEGGRKLTFRLSLGQLAPATTPEGIRARLRNLGFDPGGLQGELDALSRSAVRAFEIVAGLPITGKVEGATLDALTRAHDKR